MATFHFTLLIGLKNKKGTKKKKEELVSTKKGTFPIYLSVTHNRKLARYKTSVELASIDFWNAKEEVVRKSCPDYQILNKRLEDLLRKGKDAEEVVKSKDKEVTSKAIVETLRRIENNTLNRTFSFFEFAEMNIEEIYSLGKFGNYQRHYGFLKRLRCFVNRIKPENAVIRGKGWTSIQKRLTKDLLFSDITYSFLNDYESYLHKCPNNLNKGLLLNQNTILTQMKIFRTIFLKGQKRLEDEGLTIEKNPFDKYECKGAEAKEKDKLTLEEIEALKSLDLKEDCGMWHTRNCFLFAFYCGGMRSGDVVQIRGCFVSKEEDCYRLKYVMDKTSKMKNIVLLPEAIEILKNYIDIDNPTSDYVFPFLKNSVPYAKAITPEQKEALSPDEIKHLKRAIGSSNALLNKYLKKLSEKAKIHKRISMHVARHSFADLARKSSENIYDIKSILGHSDIKTTQIYLSKVDTDTQDKALQNVFRKEDEKAELLKKLKSLDVDTLRMLLERV